jgi:hypothetical protein
MTTELIKLNIISSLLKEDPTTPVLDLLNELILLNHTDLNNGIKTLSSLTEVSSGSSTEELFELNSILLIDSCNTVVLFSETPFLLRIGSGEIWEDVYHFSFTSVTPIDIYVSNHSTEDDVTIRYLSAQSDVLGSSYVYS